MKPVTIWLLTALLAGCAGQGSSVAKQEGITTYGVIDVGISNR